MLAQSFKSADELGISEPQKDALIKTLVLLETGKLIHVAPGRVSRQGDVFTGHFNMQYFNRASECGTVCCIAGTAELICGVVFGDISDQLQALFYGGPFGKCASSLEKLTPAQAATALRSYLTTGDARWDLAVA